jgi:hypothetical protein
MYALILERQTAFYDTDWIRFGLGLQPRATLFNYLSKLVFVISFRKHFAFLTLEFKNKLFLHSEKKIHSNIIGYKINYFVALLV